MFRLPSLRTTSVAVICFLILVVLAIPHAPATTPVARENGPQKAAEGQPVGQADFHAVVLTDKNKPQPKVLTHPNEMALVAAKSKVFNVKTLKS